MTISLRLAFFREYRHWEFEDVARELGISSESYKDLENGKTKMNGTIAQKLSDLYRAPLEFFIIDDTPHDFQADIVYTNCTFTGEYVAGYINHQYNDRGIDEILYLRKEENKALKQQIEELRQQNSRLMEMLGARLVEQE
jgi:transcriptional regulator with XRE-family HTH domain